MSSVSLAAQKQYLPSAAIQHRASKSAPASKPARAQVSQEGRPLWRPWLTVSVGGPRVEGGRDIPTLADVLLETPITHIHIKMLVRRMLDTSRWVAKERAALKATAT